MSVRCSVITGATVAAAAAVLLAGCASVTDGTGSAFGSVSHSAPPTSSVPAPASSGEVPTSAASSAQVEPSDSSSSGPSECGTDYCDDFSDASSGWPVANTQNYYANYDDYRGGTYRAGERTTKAKTLLAPVDTTTISADYGVQIDVDAVLGESAPPGSFVGIVCWDHHADSGREAGFLFYVTADAVGLTLLPDSGSDPQTIGRNQGGAAVKPYPGTNHLTATCVQRRSAGGTEADLTLAIDGATVLHEQYANSVKNYPWSPGSRAGLLVGGQKSDVFYDNFALTST